LTEAIDTTTPAGRMMMQMVGAFAEFERAMLRERTKTGLDAARQRHRLAAGKDTWLVLKEGRVCQIMLTDLRHLILKVTVRLSLSELVAIKLSALETRMKGVKCEGLGRS
jgi:DNA invertase Pin-like site-specific DNA recombinase